MFWYFYFFKYNYQLPGIYIILVIIMLFPTYLCGGLLWRHLWVLRKTNQDVRRHFICEKPHFECRWFWTAARYGNGRCQRYLDARSVISTTTSPHVGKGGANRTPINKNYREFPIIAFSYVISNGKWEMHKLPVQTCIKSLELGTQRQIWR